MLRLESRAKWLRVGSVSAHNEASRKHKGVGAMTNVCSQFSKCTKKGGCRAPGAEASGKLPTGDGS